MEYLLNGMIMDKRKLKEISRMGIQLMSGLGGMIMDRRK